MTSARPHRRLPPATALLGALALAVTGCAGGSGNSGDQQSPAGDTPSSPATATAPDGPVHVFADFACPHCASFHDAYGEQLHSLARDGEVTVDYRIVDFLGAGDPESWSTRAAQAYYCLEEETDGSAEALYEYRGWLYGQAAEGEPATDQELVEQAAQLGGDAASADIGQCVAEDGGSEQITAASADFSDAGLRGVPAVYVDGTLYDPDEHGELISWLTGESPAGG